MWRYLSVDCETTGLSEDNCQVLELGVVAEVDGVPIEKLPKFLVKIKHPIYRFEPKALEMHLDKMGAFLKDDTRLWQDEVYPKFKAWLGNYNLGLWIAKNPAFDAKFLFKMDERFTVDLVNALDPTDQMKAPGQRWLSREKALALLGMAPYDSHTALGDCYDMIAITRRLEEVGGKKLL